MSGTPMLFCVLGLIAVAQCATVMSSADDTLRFTAAGAAGVDAQWNNFKQVHGK